MGISTTWGSRSALLRLDGYHLCTRSPYSDLFSWLSPGTGCFWLRTILQGGLLIILGLGFLVTLVKCCLKVTGSPCKQAVFMWAFQGPIDPSPPTDLGQMMVLPDLVCLSLLCRWLGRVDCWERQSCATSPLLHGHLRMGLGLERFQASDGPAGHGGPKHCKGPDVVCFLSSLSVRNLSTLSLGCCCLFSVTSDLRTGLSPG